MPHRCASARHTFALSAKVAQTSENMKFTSIFFTASAAHLRVQRKDTKIFRNVHHWQMKKVFSAIMAQYMSHFCQFSFFIFQFISWHTVCPIYRRKAPRALKKINRPNKALQKQVLNINKLKV